MAPLTRRCGSLLRSLPRRNLRALPSTLPQRRHKADVVQRAAGEFDQTPSGQSPFRNLDENPTTRVPDFSKYMSSKGETRNKTFQYFMVGSMGLLAAAGAKATVQGELMCSGCWHFEAAQMGVRETKG
jgi:ubiquinol-cytochrome c reductase iron-sulfur subunit